MAAPPLLTIRWDLDIVALSSIVHRADRATNTTGITTVFHHETIVAADGHSSARVPVISGNSFRGVLRRIGEDLTAGVLNYEQDLPMPAAHLLTNGGGLAKAAVQLTHERERTLKELIPLIALFGGAASARLMSGQLAVGKVLPVTAETAHLLPPRLHSGHHLPRTAEYFSHMSDYRLRSDQAPLFDNDTSGDSRTSPLGRFGFQTLPAGARLHSFVELNHVTSIQAAFMHAILERFATRGHLGGRIAAGHGRIRADLIVDEAYDPPPGPEIDWVGVLSRNRVEAIAALQELA